ncbi:MAG: hypothetical protein WBA74_01520 [Cyclobacteriaceae bacterium]
MRKITISLEESVFNGLQKVIGKGQISRFINDLAKPYVVAEGLDKAYVMMSQDEDSENEALEWSEAIIGDMTDETG